MPTPSPHPQVGWSITLWSLGLGVIFAIPSGIGFIDTGAAEVNQPGAVVSMRSSFEPVSALFGLLIGGGAGALIGTLWYLPKHGPVVAAVLLTLVGGLVGLVAAALLGAKTTVVVSGRSSMSARDAASPTVLALGAGLGAAVTGLAVWGIRRSMRLQQRDTGVMAEPVNGPKSQ